MTSVSQHVAETIGYKEKSKTRNEAPYAEVRIGKLRQNTTCHTALMEREHFNVQREILLWGFVKGKNRQVPLYAHERY